MINEELIKKLSKDLATYLKPKKITLENAKEILEKSEIKAKEMNISVVVAIVDDSGNLIAQHRMDDALLISIPTAYSKAYTAIALKMSTEKFSKLVLPGQPLYGLKYLEGGKLCPLGGGIPLIRNGIFIGAIGVSGGSVEEDIIIAKSGVF